MTHMIFDTEELSALRDMARKFSTERLAPFYQSHERAGNFDRALIRAAQGRSQPAPSSVLQINQAPVLPAVTPVQTPTPASSSGWSRPAPPPPLIELPASGESSDPGASLTSTRP